jgi:glutathione peroxidase
MSIFDHAVATLDGTPSSLAPYRGQTLLIVNVASRCGLTPQYAGLEELQRSFAGRGLQVLGFPCNQFAGQEPGSPEEIATFCSTTYGVTFPLFEKVDVNGEGRHPIFAELTRVPDAEGEAGDVQWNFEKFLVAPDGRVTARFRPGVEPSDPRLVAALETVLAG